MSIGLLYPSPAQDTALLVLFLLLYSSVWKVAENQLCCSHMGGGLLGQCSALWPGLAVLARDLSQRGRHARTGLVRECGGREAGKHAGGRMLVVRGLLTGALGAEWTGLGQPPGCRACRGSRAEPWACPLGLRAAGL